ncbi:MAG: MBL fold metallo-hydrolase [Chloroflexota bacterium]
MMHPRLILLGTKGGPTVRVANVCQTSTALMINKQLYVIDCGTGVSRRVVEAGLPLQALRYVFITHHHSDHTLEYGGLLHNAWSNGLKTRLDVFGPPGTAQMTDDFWRMMQIDINLRIHDEGRPDLRKLIFAHDNPVFDRASLVDDKNAWLPVTHPATCLIMENDDVRVTGCWTPHLPFFDNYGLKFEVKDATGGISKTIVFSSDTGYYPPLAQFAHGADVLIHEVMHNDGIEALIKRILNVKPDELRRHFYQAHTLCEDVGRIAQVAQVQQLVLHHYVPSDDPHLKPDDWIKAVQTTFAGKVTCGRDLLEIEI